MRRTVCVGMACLLFLQGCTFAGALVGIGVESLTTEHYSGKRYCEVNLQRGQKVALTTRARRRVAGTYDGYLAPTDHDPRAYVVVALEGADGVLSRVATDDIAQVDVMVPGKGWLYGGIVGAVVDVTLIVLVAVYAANMHWDPDTCEDGANASGGCWVL